MDYDIVNEVADAKRQRRETEVLKITGKVTSAPESGESKSGKRFCIFDVEDDTGFVVKMYTVRYREEAMRLAVGDTVTVRYIHEHGFNNVVGSIVLEGEGNVLRNIQNTVLDLGKRMNLLLDNQVKTLSKLGDIQKKVDWLAQEAETWEDDGK